ncbi:MAG: hypothetical protein ACFFG0_48470 [Candidatus Thorarchaeota archaeon]
MWEWIIGTVIVVIILFVIFKKKNKNYDSDFLGLSSERISSGCKKLIGRLIRRDC